MFIGYRMLALINNTFTLHLHPLTGQAATLEDRARGAAPSAERRRDSLQSGSQSWYRHTILTLNYSRAAEDLSQQQIKSNNGRNAVGHEENLVKEKY